MFIQLQATTPISIDEIISTCRKIIGDICLGIDDMHKLGNKALVLRAEIFAKDIVSLCEQLENADITILPSSVPALEHLNQDQEYPFTLQIVNYSNDSDGKVTIPNVPG